MGTFSSKTIRGLLTTFLFLAVSFGLFHSAPANALTGSDFQAGRIIDDAVFTDTSSMSVADINNFIAAKMPSCDTTGSLSVSYWWDSSTGYAGSSREKDSNGNYTYADTYTTTSRAIYGQRYGDYHGTTVSKAPYVCLKDYRENPNTHQNNLQGATVSGGVTAGEIIYYAALGYHINPQVLLVTLQKEQSLIGDDWPWTNEYSAAMGYMCPDDGTGCHSAYAGFAVQVNSAAWQFRYYLDNNGAPGIYWTGNNNIPYNPDSGCGSSVVNIVSGSTAALYDYTPYQPNQATLDNTNPTGSSSGPGPSVSCGAYGNRNFWWYFNTWFGSTTAINGSIQMASSLTLSKTTSAYVNDTVTATYQVKNTASYDINAGSLGICARLNGQWSDFGFTNDVVVPAGQTIPISFTKTLTAPGTLSVYTCSYNPAFGWASDKYPYDLNGGITRQASLTVGDNPIITSGLILGPSNPGIQQEVTAYASVKNMSSNPINIDSLVIAARDPYGNNVDFPIKNDVIIPAATQSDLTWKRTFTTPGKYSFSIAHWNGSWDTTYPHSSSSAIIRQLSWPILDNPLISSGITITTSSPTAGTPVDATITFRNTSGSDINLHSMVIAARDSSGKNFDFPIQNDVIVPANSAKTVTWTRTFSAPGNYSLFIAHWWNNWDTTYPKSMDSSVQRQTTLKVN